MSKRRLKKKEMAKFISKTMCTHIDWANEQNTETLAAFTLWQCSNFGSVRLFEQALPLNTSNYTLPYLTTLKPTDQHCRQGLKLWGTLIRLMLIRLKTAEATIKSHVRNKVRMSLGHLLEKLCSLMLCQCPNSMVGKGLSFCQGP